MSDRNQLNSVITAGIGIVGAMSTLKWMSSQNKPTNTVLAIGVGAAVLGSNSASLLL